MKTPIAQFKADYDYALSRMVDADRRTMRGSMASRSEAARELNQAGQDQRKATREIIDTRPVNQTDKDIQRQILGDNIEFIIGALPGSEFYDLDISTIQRVISC